MSEYHAAIALEMLTHWELHASERRYLYAELRHKLNAASGQKIVWQYQGCDHSTIAPTLMCLRLPDEGARDRLEQVCQDRKSTRLNSSHLVISYAVFCLKKKS